MMTKEKLLEEFTKDFAKAQGAINELIDHNRTIDSELVEDLSTGDFKKLEEHIEISKLISDGIKSFNELYKNAPSIIEGISKMSDTEDKQTQKKSVKELLDSIPD